MQIKTTRLANGHKFESISVGEEVGQPKHFYTVGEKCHQYNHFEKQF